MSKGQGISINVIVIAALALLVLVLLSVIVINALKNYNRTANSCDTTKGASTCRSLETGCQEGEARDGRICFDVLGKQDNTQVCCNAVQ